MYPHRQNPEEKQVHIENEGYQNHIHKTFLNNLYVYERTINETNIPDVKHKIDLFFVHGHFFQPDLHARGDSKQ